MLPKDCDADALLFELPEIKQETKNIFPPVVSPLFSHAWYMCSRHADAARHFFIPGWEVPQTWPAAATARGTGGGYGGVPDDGHFTVEYCSDEVQTDMRLRKYFAWMKPVLVFLCC